jgi:hypothetical protein
MTEEHPHHRAPHDDDADRRPDDARRPTWLEGVDEAHQGERERDVDSHEHGRDPYSGGGSEQPPPDPADQLEPPHLERGSPREDNPDPADESPPPAADDAPPPEQPGR